MSLVEIQQKSLEIMKHLHSFCVSNKLSYSLMDGSLIGAIRHNGFIPWDDDIDIMMPRKDFDHLCEIYEDTEGLKLFCPQRHNNYVPYGRLCDMKETYARPFSPIAPIKSGIWIDIFPIDKVDDDPASFINKNRKLKTLHKRINRCRYAIAPYGHYGYSPAILLRQFTKKVLFGKNIYKYVNKFVDSCVCISNDSSHSSGVLSVSQYEKFLDNQHFPDSVFNSFELSKFEDSEFFIIKHYDQYLRAIFGNYMELPPQEERVGHLGHKTFWI